ncbi:MAG TPA: penicillin-binding protein [Candidatus Paceibacterota bacterium]
MLVVSVIIFFGGIFFLWVSTFEIPALDSFAKRKVVESTKIYDRTGEVLLYDVNQDIRRTVVPFDKISRNTKNATIAIEDREFYEHNGIQIKSILRAFFANTTSLGFSQGGSTITQQVVKVSLLSPKKTITRKIKEVFIAIKLEKVISKDEILYLYLNEIPYGGNLYGIEEASLAFLGKSASELSVAESAYLAALPQAPTFYSPYGTHRDRLEERKNLVLSEMLRNGFIDENEYKEALSEEVQFKPRETSGIKAPHFVFFVLEELNKKYGEETVRDGGLRVKTTLDYAIQKQGEEIAKEYALKNKVSFNAENAAFVAIDPKTGGILSMVGSRDYFDKEIDGNFNVATAHRQPGSAFKPFVYAKAFQKGYTPETVVFDVRTQFSSECRPDDFSKIFPCYSPDNYDEKFRGPISMRDSLAQSVNVTSVKTLYLAGIRDSISLAKNMGIESLGVADQYGLTLVLGGGEVSLLDIVSGYGVFANEGVRNPHHSIIEVKDKSDNILEEWKRAPNQVLEKEIALKISSILSDNVARSPLYGPSSVINFESRDVAVKTGTTNDYRDAWIIGYTPSVALGAWAGNNDNSPMEKKISGLIVAPMWRVFMDKILATTTPEFFPEPQVIDSYDLKPVLRGKWQGGFSNLIDSVSGKLATADTPREVIQEILDGGVHSILYWLKKNDPRGQKPSNPAEDQQFERWEYGVQTYLKQTGYTPPINPMIPTENDDIHNPQSSPKVIIFNPKNNDVYNINQNIDILVQGESRYRIKKAEFYLNGSYLGESTTIPLRFSFIPENLTFIQKQNSLRVVLYDEIYNKGESVITFLVNLP